MDSEIVICEYERCRKPFERIEKSRRFCSESCRKRFERDRRAAKKRAGISTKRPKKIFSCQGCGKRLARGKRTKYGLCRQCLDANLRKQRDDRVFRAIVEFRTANRGLSPRQREIAELAGYSRTLLVTLSIKRLEEAGRIKCLLSPSGFRVQYDIPGSRWVYEEAEERNV